VRRGFTGRRRVELWELAMAIIFGAFIGIVIFEICAHWRRS
jgi:hypothetical protein